MNQQYPQLYNRLISSTTTNATNSAAIENPRERVDEIDNDLKMIRMVKQFQILYSTDESHKECKLEIINLRKYAWKVVANEVGMSGKYNNIKIIMDETSGWRG